MSDFEDSLKAVLAWWDDAGVDVPDIPKPTPQRRTAPTRKATPKTQTARPVGSKSLPVSNSVDAKDRVEAAKSAATSAKTLDDLKVAITGFDAGILSDGAMNPVFARGNPDANIMIIGEAPGRDEDIASEPFVGKSGQFLDKMFAAIGLDNSQLYITNVVNWRPPNNRNPNADEIAMCLPLITRHIQLVAPKVIVLVGGVALNAMTGLTGIMKLRGQWQDLAIGDDTIPALPLYHPAFLLRRPELKRDAWHDLIALRAHIDDNLGF